MIQNAVFFYSAEESLQPNIDSDHKRWLFFLTLVSAFVSR